MGSILIALLLVCTGTAMAGEQGDCPAILASLQTSENIVTLDDESMDRIEGTFFCLPDMHPTLGEVVCTFFSFGQGGDETRLGWMLETAGSHLCYIRTKIVGGICNNFKPTR
jgi:hypothetical protein